jgi:hypothetical protein
MAVFSPLADAPSAVVATRLVAFERARRLTELGFIGCSYKKALIPALPRGSRHDPSMALRDDLSKTCDAMLKDYGKQTASGGLLLEPAFYP